MNSFDKPGYDRVIAALEAAGSKRQRDMWQCPAHDDERPSLHVTEDPAGSALVHCHGGCDTESVIGRLGLEMSDLFGEPSRTPVQQPSIVTAYDYTDEDGNLLYQVCRMANKQFRQRVPDPTSSDRWLWRLGQVRRVLYRLPEVVAAVARNDAVYLCEGEKDVEALRKLGLAATCNPGGAGKWREEYNQTLKGAEVVVIADRDTAGHAHALAIAAALAGVAARTKVVEAAEGKDVSDHLDAGLPLDELVEVSSSDLSKSSAEPDLQKLLEVAMGAELFHSPGYEPYAKVPVDSHQEIWPVRSRRFKTWLAGRLYDAHGKVPSASAKNDLLTLLEGIAVHGSPMHDVHLRVAECGDAIYLDLGNAAWEAVEISPGGWRTTSDPAVRFRRTAGTQPLPLPESGGSVGELRPFVNVDDDGWILYISWLLACFRPRGPYPVLDLLGEQGAAKSTAARVARELVDPSRAPLRTAPRDPRDFVVTTTNSWVTALDNLSSIPEWLSDILCRLSTGGGYVTRELYTDQDEVIFDAQRPVILTGITELATRSDLLDRALLVSLPRIPEEARRPEKDFWHRFEQAKPRILGALLDAVSTSLRNQPSIQLERLPRMADFAVWSAAAAPALGWTADDFLAAYERNRASVHEVALEDTLIGHPLLELGRRGFEGNSTELLKQLGALVDESTAKDRSWPKSARALSGQIRRLAPNLRALGVHVEFDRETTGQKRRLVTLTPRSQPVTLATAVTGPAAPGTGGDGTGDARPEANVTGADQQLTVRDAVGDHSDASDEGDGSVRPANDHEEAMIEALRQRHSDLVEEEPS